MSIYAILLVVMGLSGLYMGFMSWLGQSGLMARHRRRQDKPYSIPDPKKKLNSALNSLVSTGLVFGLVALSSPWVIDADKPPSALAIVTESVMILLIYDLGYYLLHRFVLHEWKPGRRIHAVHHMIRTPYARDSLWIHPVETALGIALLMASTLLTTQIVGPVSPWSFGVCFFVYSILNIHIHAAFDLDFFPFRTLTVLSRNHDAHHRSMKGGYYASITPLWDHVFGTADDY